MKTKKYQGETEEQVIEMAKNELGKDAIVLSIKKITPTGIFSIMKKPYIELVASYDEKQMAKGKSEDLQAIIKDKDLTIERLEKRVKDLENYIEKALKGLSKEQNQNNKYKNNIVQFIYDMLYTQGVLPEICDSILKPMDKEENQNVDLIVKMVYNKIKDMLNVAVCEDLEVCAKKNNTKNIVFLGTTGVGKTTTIAKLSSELIMGRDKKVGFITADTYRIAAVEQLKTYAEILGSQVEVVYKPQDLKSRMQKLSVINDYIFFDTAGRSHKNDKNMQEIKEFINEIENKEIYLVLSSTARFEDIEDIITAYEKFTNFNIIFTKIDETSTLGVVLNTIYKKNKKVAYVTVGQNVPYDIERFSGEKIAKVLLGSMYR